jgi:ABC-type sugar transport system permease subunit/ABC-type glycerol-3-phosphate transport system substrate-binding protein
VTFGGGEVRVRWMVRLAAVVTLLAGACGAAEKRSQPLVLRLDSVPSLSDRRVTERARRAILERFLDLHPEIRVQPVQGISLEGLAGEAAIYMAFAGGTAPTVVNMQNFRTGRSFMVEHLVQPLDADVAAWRQEDPEGVDRHFPPVAMPAVTQDGKIHGVPINFYKTVLFYRADLFRQAGLDPNRPPRNWDELYAYAQKLTVPEKGQYGFGLPRNTWETSWMLMDFVWQGGGEMIYQMPDGQWRVGFNSPAGVQALKFYQKLAHEPWERNGKRYTGVVSPSMDSQTELFNGGKIAMMYWDIGDKLIGSPDLNPDVARMALLPVGPTGLRGAQLNTEDFLGISAVVKDPEVRRAAWEYIRFMASDEAAKIRTRTYIEAGMARFANARDLKRFGYERYLDEIPPNARAIQQDFFADAKPEPYAPGYRSIQTVELQEITDRVMAYPGIDVKQLLETYARRCDTLYFGYHPPEEMARKRRVGWILFIPVVLLIVGAAVLTIRSLTPDETAPGRRPRPSDLFMAWGFMLPALLSVAVWAYWPLIQGAVMAFYEWHILAGSRFIGLDNFIEAFSQPMFYKTLGNTLVYVGMTLALGFLAPLALALMLTEIPRGTLLYRTMFYLPAVTAGPVIALLWRGIFDPSPTGVLNRGLSLFNLPAQLWLGDARLAMVCVVISGVWAGTGAASLIYQAALTGIPDELYESASVEGAGPFSKLWRITLPQLKPLLLINFVGAFVGAVKAAENILVMTGGGPMMSTRTIGLEIFFNAFLYLKFGYATALAWILGAMLIGFTLYQLRMLKSLRFSAARA